MLNANIVLERSMGVEDYLSDNPEYSVPDYLYQEGAEADYIFFIGVVSDRSLSWVGAATSIIKDPKTKQPIIGMFDLNYLDNLSYEDLLNYHSRNGPCFRLRE